MSEKGKLKDQASIQICTAWVNDKLDGAGHPIVEDDGEGGGLLDAMADGVAFARVLEQVGDGVRVKVRNNPTMVIFKLENVKLCLARVAELGIETPGVSAQDFVDRRAKQVTAVLHKLIDRFDPEYMDQRADILDALLASHGIGPAGSAHERYQQARDGAINAQVDTSYKGPTNEGLGLRNSLGGPLSYRADRSEEPEPESEDEEPPRADLETVAEEPAEGTIEWDELQLQKMHAALDKADAIKAEREEAQMKAVERAVANAREGLVASKIASEKATSLRARARWKKAGSNVRATNACAALLDFVRTKAPATMTILPMNAATMKAPKGPRFREPSEEELADMLALPFGWECAQDRYNRRYFFNADLDMSQWERPADEGAHTAQEERKTALQDQFEELCEEANAREYLADGQRLAAGVSYKGGDMAPIQEVDPAIVDHVLPKLKFSNEMRSLHVMGFADMDKNLEALNQAEKDEAGSPDDLLQHAVDLLTVSAKAPDPYLVAAAETPYFENLAVLRDMGFTDLDANIEALKKVEGHPHAVRAAMGYLLQ